MNRSDKTRTRGALLQRLMLTPALLLVPVLLTAADSYAEPPQCTGCHASPPVGENHVPLVDSSVRSCLMCHKSQGDDPFFRDVHERHAQLLDCQVCHTNTDAEDRARLLELLEGT